MHNHDAVSYGGMEYNRGSIDEGNCSEEADGKASYLHEKTLMEAKIEGIAFVIRRKDRLPG